MKNQSSGKATFQATCERYNYVAGFRGWLPVGIGQHSTARTLRDGAERIRWLNLDVAMALETYARAGIVR